ncbi:universal stress protein [Tunturiibacter lichenicola]|jgi:nucleotide-binding universal stress UspA family protein|uniref:universal stress protein n=1 Tax=Tunturiibacter lichenicola TaxID=2051959 RepID=UPI003D9BA06A
MFAVVNSTPTRVLLATDFSAASRAAFQAALVLCLSFRADLYILNVFEYANANPPESGGMLLELDSFYHDAEQSLDSLVKEARHSDITCDGWIGSGTSHSTILETAEAEHADIIVLGTRSIHGFERLVFGSTAEAVLRGANCPVFTVGPRAATQRPEEGAGPGVVVFATDFHDTTTEALQIATSFCSSMNLSLHCLHVLPRGVEDNFHKGIIPVIITEALQHLVATVENKTGPPVCAVTYGSEISSAVVDYAQAHKARLIVLGVRRASLAASHTPAHIAYRIIAEAPCPVLTVAFPLGHETGSLDPMRDAQDINEGQPLMRLRQPTIQ